MTAAERLLQLSKLSGVTAAAALLAIGSGANAGQALTNYSQLQSGTASEHLLTEKQQLLGGGGGIVSKPVGGKRTKKQIKKDWQSVLAEVEGVVPVVVTPSGLGVPGQAGPAERAEAHQTTLNAPAVETAVAQKAAEIEQAAQSQQLLAETKRKADEEALLAILMEVL